MVKVWKDLNELTFAEVPSNLKEFDKTMKSIPNFEKNEGARKIYQRKEYAIYKVNNGFIIHNIKKDFEIGHTHLKSFNTCKLLIDCSINNKLPKTRNHYLLRSLIRISNDNKFKIRVENLIDTREGKELQKYVIKK